MDGIKFLGCVALMLAAVMGFMVLVEYQYPGAIEMVDDE